MHAEYDHHLHMKIPSGLMAKLREEAARRMTTVSEIIRQATIDRLEGAEKERADAC